MNAVVADIVHGPWISLCVDGNPIAIGTLSNEDKAILVGTEKPFVRIAHVFLCVEEANCRFRHCLWKQSNHLRCSIRRDTLLDKPLPYVVFHTCRDRTSACARGLPPLSTRRLLTELI